MENEKRCIRECIQRFLNYLQHFFYFVEDI